MERYLVTAALPYANGPIHIGHLAGAYIPADIYVRFLRLNGDDVVFICGTDEHGVPITIRAEKEGKTPQEIVDYYHEVIKKSFEGMRIEFDNFSRTTREIHHKTAQEFFLKLLENGALVAKKEKGLYCPNCKIFLPDRYVEGTCPVCGADGARGDQCEKCGTWLEPFQLINPKCKICGATPEERETTHFYFKLGDYQKRLEEFVYSHDFWRPNVINYCRNWFEEGLRDRAITRDLLWGIKVPLDDEEFKSKVLYVWFEAPIGYISSTKEWAIKIGDPDRWKLYWQDKNTRIVHFIGKDNIVFHAIVFPATLMAYGDEWNLVYDIPANEFLNIEDEKISTSRNWAVWVDEYLEEFEPDPLRYYLTMIAPENSDSNFTWEGFQKHNNTELADVIGNYVNRVLTFIARNFDSKIPEYSKDDLGEYEKNLLKEEKEFFNKFYENLHNKRFKRALTEYIEFYKKLNKYFNDMKPWELVKEDKKRAGEVLAFCVKLLRDTTVMMYPFMPTTAERIWVLINELRDIKEERWDRFLDIFPEPNREIKRPKKVLFRKFADEEIKKQKEKLIQKSKEEIEKNKKYKPLKTEITIEDFQKLDIRVGKILSAEKVKGADKLLKMEVDLGFEKRTIVGGLKKYYSSEELIGKYVIVLANLKPRKLKGIESQGMLLAVVNDENISLLEPDNKDKINLGDVIG